MSRNKINSMKKLLTICLSLMLISSFLQSCGNAENNSGNAGEATDPCEELITEYEKLCDDYLAIVNKMKANPTDMSAVSDFNEMQTKAQKMERESKDCTDPKYTDRVMKITNKMMQAASGF